MPEWPPDIPGFAAARVVRRLGAGPVADSWLLEHEEQQWVLRRDRLCAHQIGLDRQCELRALEAAYARGLAPEPLEVTVDPAIRITRFVPGETWQEAADRGRPGNWSRLGGLLRQVHTLSPETVPRFRPAEVFGAYGEAAGTSEARALARDLVACADPLYRDAPWVLCHHDPHLGNVIGEPGVLIDWEYAALGHPLFDLAFVIEYHGLDATAQSALVAGWAGDDAPVSPRALGDFRVLVAGVNRLWSLAIDACD